MSSSFYTTYLGMQARQDAIDVIANNLANASTSGFKADNAFFQAYQNAVDGITPGTEMEQVDKSVRLEAAKTDFSSGAVRETGRDLDVALDGEGFFVVQTRAGERYTRNGSFTLSSDGQLVTHEGDRVIGQGGPITIPPGAITFDEQGNISVDAQQVGSLRVVRFPRNDLLMKEGNNVFSLSDPAVTPSPAVSTRVVQGRLESSNVNPMREMALMMKYMREFESLQRTLTSITTDLNTSSMGRVTS